MSANRDGSRRFSYDHFYLASRGAETNTLLFLGMPSFGMPSKAARRVLPSLFPLFSSPLFPSSFFFDFLSSSVVRAQSSAGRVPAY